MKPLFWILFLLLLPLGGHAQKWNRLIKKSQKSKTILTDGSLYPMDNMYINLFYQARKMIPILDLLEVDLKNDTIYFLERYGDRSDICLDSNIWNKKKLISYCTTWNLEPPVIEYNKVGAFTAYMMRLCSKWDLKGLKKEEENPDGETIPMDTACLTRLIIQNHKYFVDCVLFKNFFVFERDMKNDWLYEHGEYNIW